MSNKNFQNCNLMLYQGFNPSLNKYIYMKDAFLVYVLVAFTAIPSYKKKITAQSLVVYTLKCDVSKDICLFKICSLTNIFVLIVLS